jgi:hypothetical protein
VTEAISAATVPGAVRTRARAVAKLTDAEATPGTRASAVSTRRTQAAQVMPRTARSTMAVPSLSATRASMQRTWAARG